MSSGKSQVRKAGVKLPGRLVQGLDDVKETRPPAVPQSDPIIAPPPPRESRSSEKALEFSEGDLRAKSGEQERKPTTEDPARKKRRKGDSLDPINKLKDSSKADSSVDPIPRKKEKKSSPASSVVVEVSRIGDDSAFPASLVDPASATLALTSPALLPEGQQVSEAFAPPTNPTTSVNWVVGEDCTVERRELIPDPSLKPKAPVAPLKTSKAPPLIFASEVLDMTRCLDRVVRLYDRELRNSRSRVTELEASAVEGAVEKLEAATLRLKEDEEKMGELLSRLAIMHDRCQKLESMVVVMKDERDSHDAPLKRTITRLRGERSQDLAELERSTAEVSCYQAVLTKVETYLAGRSARKEAEAALNRTLGALDCLEMLEGGRDKAAYKTELLALRGEQEKLVQGEPSLELSDLIVTVNDVDKMLEGEIARKSVMDALGSGED